MMKRVVWFSRHGPLPSQIRELERVFGLVEIVHDPNPFANADEIVERFRQAQGDEMVLVAPFQFFASLCARGIRPLRAEMEVVSADDPRRETEASGRWYRFTGFVRVVELRLVTEPLSPQ